MCERGAGAEECEDSVEGRGVGGPYQDQDIRGIEGWAIERYVEASRLAPSNVLILWKLATAYQKKEAWADVASTLVFATKLAPAHADYFFLMGYAQSKLARWADAK